MTIAHARCGSAGIRPQALVAWLLALLLSLALAACGGSGAGAGGPGPELGIGTENGGGSGEDGPLDLFADSRVTSITLLSDAVELASDGKTPATLTAIVKDKGNRVVADQEVRFSTADQGVMLEVDSTTTDSRGRVSAELWTSDPQPRTIKVRAVVVGDIPGVEDLYEIPVAGSRIGINGPATLAFNTPSDFMVSLRDSGSKGIANVPVTLVSAKGNTVATSPALTDVNGQVRFEVTGTVDGADTLTASALGIQASESLMVSGTQLEFVVPDAAGTELLVNQSHEVRVRLVENNAPVAGKTLQFTSTRGNLTPTPATVVTDGSGEAAVQLQSPNAGYATLTVREGANASASMTFEFISQSPTKITVQASPAVVGVNLSPQGTRSSQLIAVVRDSHDNPVKNVAVDFSFVQDPSGGKIEPASARTDSSGAATASFVPGPNSSGPEGVVVRATVSGTALSNDTQITAAEQPLSVVIGTGNKIEEADSTTYRMPWTALVTDSSGAAVANASVGVQLEPLAFRTGKWIPGGSGWVQDVNATCPSEDTNRNGQLDTGEDITDPDVGTIGRLDPGSVAAWQHESSGAVTNGAGEAKITINYPQGFGAWVQYRLRVTITAPAGTEGAAVSEFWLPVLAAHVNNADTLPPGEHSPRSPYGEGVGAGCVTP